MHQTLLETLSNAGGELFLSKSFKLSRNCFCPVLNVYIGGKYYGSTILSEFDIPTQFNEMDKIVTIARVMLNVKVS